jgi:predicted amidophosphoribosyltransferase
MLSEVLARAELREDSFVTFVPQTWMRFCYRGFNQAKILAEPFGPLNLIGRNGLHNQMAGLSKDERFNAMRDSFYIRGEPVLQHFTYCYLVDDVYTTGGTARAVASAVKRRYPHLQVVALTFAKTKKLF